MSKTPRDAKSFKQDCFEHSNFDHLILFRISDFVLRIYTSMVSIKFRNTWYFIEENIFRLAEVDIAPPGGLHKKPYQLNRFFISYGNYKKSKCSLTERS